jgi:hypothetical protein
MDSRQAAKAPRPEKILAKTGMTLAKTAKIAKVGNDSVEDL